MDTANEVVTPSRLLEEARELKDRIEELVKNLEVLEEFGNCELCKEN